MRNALGKAITQRSQRWYRARPFTASFSLPELYALFGAQCAVVARIAGLNLCLSRLGCRFFYLAECLNVKFTVEHVAQNKRLITTNLADHKTFNGVKAENRHK